MWRSRRARYCQTGLTEPRSSEPPGGRGVTIVAEDTAFDTTNLDAAVGETLAITFDNRDDGIPHNLSVEGASDGDAKTDIEQGPTTQTVEVSFDDAGVSRTSATSTPSRCVARARCRRDRTMHPHTELTPRCRRAQGARGHSPELWRYSPGHAGKRRTRQGC